MLDKLDRVLILEGNDPLRNLAVEEALLTLCENADDEFEPRVLLYVNSPSVVLGKFQNPWLECDVEWMTAASYPVLRRVSGGGTVWHDLGNINYSFLVPRIRFDKEANLNSLVRVLSDMGVELSTNDRGDLMFGDLKVSGNAMCYKRYAVLHHGTLLVNSQLNLLRRALGVSIPGRFEIESPSVRSKRAPVSMIGKEFPEFETSTCLVSLANGLASLMGGEPTSLSTQNTDTLLEWANTRAPGHTGKYGKWEWNFGATPRFEIVDTITNELWVVEKGIIERVRDENGRVTDIKTALPFDGFERLGQRQVSAA